jgi:molybdenum cofactor biosynthesis enzyme MoaA
MINNKIKIISNTFPPELLRIEFMLGNLCNYRCSYCFPGSNEGDLPWAEPEIVIKHFDHMLRHYIKNGKTKFSMYLIGGETTLWRGMEEFCTHVKKNFDIYIQVSTNATRSVRWWKENGTLFDHVAISVHSEEADPDHIIQVADALFELGIFVNADVLMAPDNFDKCKENLEKLKSSKHPWPIVTKPVYYKGKHQYDDHTQLEFLEQPYKRIPPMDWYHKTHKKPPTQTVLKYQDGKIETLEGDGYLIANDLNHFYGWKCNIGVDTVKIFADGKITGNCQHKLYGMDEYYNLYDPNFVEKYAPNIVPVTCSKILCPCAPETITHKEHDQ